MTAFSDILARLAEGERLNLSQAKEAFEIMMRGEATPAQMGAFLMALRLRGETVEEITGGAQALREFATRINAPADAIDTCGTGGDSSGSYNISTAVGLVLAGCGVPVAKHGNKAQSSKAGSAEVLAALGVDVEASTELVEQAIREAGFGFMLAPRHHGAMRHVAPVRRELVGTRTIFNLLGPLANPAGTKRQLIGVFAKEWVEPIAEVLRNLGSEKVWVVHGSDGMDELTTTGPTTVAALDGETITTFEVTPEDAGLSRARPEDLKGGSPNDNAAALTRLLAGESGAYRDIVLLNAAAGLIVADKVPSLRDGIAMAADAIDSGRASDVLRRVAALTKGTAEQADKGSVDKGNVLESICAEKHAHVSALREQISEDDLKAQAAATLPPRGFAAALKVAAMQGPALIAEIKKASPSKGIIREDFDPATLARAYADAGATCLSVLTDMKHFQGRPDDLKAARAAVDLPVLRKDFIVDPYQVVESRAMGADCILLIMAALTDTLAGDLEAAALDLGMDVLIEVHNREELDRALELRSPLIGINNRNLKTLEVNLETSIELAPLVPPARLVIAESGIAGPEDIAGLQGAGIHAFLVGESLMREPDVTAATRRLLGEAL